MQFDSSSDLTTIYAKYGLFAKTLPRLPSKVATDYLRCSKVGGVRDENEPWATMGRMVLAHYAHF